MKLILNTSLDPHFCALFDLKNKLQNKLIWQNRKKDSENIYNFLSKVPLKKLTCVGALSGPGGFACLRAASVTVNCLAFASKKLCLQSLRSDKFVSFLLRNKNFKNPEMSFVLNSFGSDVFITKNKKLQKVSTSIAIKFFREKKIDSLCLDFLPKAKQSLFSDFKPIKMQLSTVEIICELCRAFQNSKSIQTFAPEYNFDIV